MENNNAGEEKQNKRKRTHRCSPRDPRLMMMLGYPRLMKEWFEGRDCLDIALSNNVTLTISIASDTYTNADKEEEEEEATENNAEEEGTEEMENNAEKEIKRKLSLRDPRLMKVTEDPRLKLFKKEWFEGKNCLDIGLCNNGTLTIYIAQEFCCQKILGIDNNSGRVKDAGLNLRKTFLSNLAMLVHTPTKASKLKDSVGASSNKDNPMEYSTLELRNDLSNIVSFKQENFFKSDYHYLRGNPYDAIICLSTTHWIDLKVRDEDLITLFRKIQKLLQPDGLFVLEPKSLEPYGSKYYISETKTTPILPESFLKTLLDKTGFKTVEQFDYHGLDLINSTNRETILVFKK